MCKSGLKTFQRTNSDLAPRRRRAGQGRRHKLDVCEVTGLPRYRDRHQALHGAEAMRAGSHDFKVNTFACPHCGGYHLEKTIAREPVGVGSPLKPVAVFTASLASRKRRYVIFDIENPTRGAKVSCRKVATLWNVIKQQAPGISPEDHIVVGAARSVARRYRTAVTGENVKWVLGADAPDGADRALLAAIDLWRVARDFDELVIISGDHAFVDLARRAREFGLTVHVVTAQHHGKNPMLSRELAAIANTRSFVRLQTRKQKQQNLARIQPETQRMRSAAVAAA